MGNLSWKDGCWKRHLLRAMPCCEVWDVTCTDAQVMAWEVSKAVFQRDFDMALRLAPNNVENSCRGEAYTFANSFQNHLRPSGRRVE